MLFLQSCFAVRQFVLTAHGTHRVYASLVRDSKPPDSGEGYDTCTRTITYNCKSQYRSAILVRIRLKAVVECTDRVRECGVCGMNDHQMAPCRAGRGPPASACARKEFVFLLTDCSPLEIKPNLRPCLQTCLPGKCSR